MKVVNTVVTPEFITLAEAAVHLSVSEDTLRRRIADGTIRGYKLAGSRGVRVRVSDVDALAEPIDVTGFAHEVDA